MQKVDGWLYILHVTYITTGNTTITLPTAQALSGRTIIIKAVGDANTYILTVDTQGSETIDGGADYDFPSTLYPSVILYSDGTNWFISSNYQGLGV